MCVCLLHVCTFAPLSRGAFWPRHAPVARCPCPCLSPRSPNGVQCPQGVVFVVSEGVSITYCGRRAAGETCVVFSMNFHTHIHTLRQIDSHILSRNALITMAHKITIYLSITNLPPTRSSFYVSASLSSVNCSQCPSQLFPVPNAIIIMLIVLVLLHLP